MVLISVIALVVLKKMYNPCKSLGSQITDDINKLKRKVEHDLNFIFT